MRTLLKYVKMRQQVKYAAVAYAHKIDMPNHQQVATLQVASVRIAAAP